MSAELVEDRGPWLTAPGYDCPNCGDPRFRWKIRHGRRRRVCVSCRSSREREEAGSPRVSCAIDLPGDPEVHRAPDDNSGPSRGLLDGDPLFGILMGTEDGLPLRRKRDGVWYGV